jgi:HPt (histidine-containing phosphotransfer) domain-containing protein
MSALIVPTSDDSDETASRGVPWPAERPAQDHLKAAAPASPAATRPADPEPADSPVCAPELPVFVWPALVERMGDEEMAHLAIEAYLEDAPASVAALHAAVSGGSAEAITRRAHAVKGAASMLSGERVRAVAAVMEATAAAGDVARAAAHLPQLEAEFERLRAALLA